MPGDRTEQATQHRREKAREEGDILHSRELAAAAGTLAGVMTLGALGAVTSEKTQLLAAQTNLMQADIPSVATQLAMAQTQQTALMDVIAQLESPANSLFSKLQG